jgi:hypothetical protein
LYQPAGKTYTTQIINNQPLVTPQSKAERYVLKLSLNGQLAEAWVDKETYGRIQSGDTVAVDYSVLRLRRRPQILQVRLP